MKIFISKLYAETLSIIYNKNIKYSHINSKGYWEFAIGDFNVFGIIEDTIVYKTKGYKGKN